MRDDEEIKRQPDQRRELYQHPQHLAVTEGQEDNDGAGTYPQRAM